MKGVQSERYGNVAKGGRGSKIVPVTRYSIYEWPLSQKSGHSEIFKFQLNFYHLLFSLFSSLFDFLHFFVFLMVILNQFSQVSFFKEVRLPMSFIYTVETPKTFSEKLPHGGLWHFFKTQGF